MLDVTLRLCSPHDWPQESCLAKEIVEKSLLPNIIVDGGHFHHHQVVSWRNISTIIGGSIRRANVEGGRQKSPKTKFSADRFFISYEVQLLEFVYWVMIMRWFGKRMVSQDSGMMDVDGVVYLQPPRGEEKRQIYERTIKPSSCQFRFLFWRLNDIWVIRMMPESGPILCSMRILKSSW